MKRTIVSTVVLLSGLLVACDNDGSSSHYSSPPNYQDTSPPSSLSTAAEVAFEIATFVIKHPVIRALELLGIVSKIGSLSQSNTNNYSYDESNKVVTFTTENPQVTGKIDASDNMASLAVFNTPNGEQNFSPEAFLVAHNLTSETDVNQLDEKIQKDYTECTDEMLNSGEGNQIKMLEIRIDCLTRRGYQDNDYVYMQIKHDITI